MKKEFSVKPEKLVEQWPGQLTQIGSWHEVITQMPQPVFVVTGWKSNGKENACLQSASTFVGSGGEFICILGWVKKDGHTHQSLKETGCCVLNFPTKGFYDKCCKTIENNGFEADEITASGLTTEKAVNWKIWKRRLSVFSKCTSKSRHRGSWRVWVCVVRNLQIVKKP